MRYTLGTAAKATGKSKTTIQRAISKGIISAEKNRTGSYSIDPSELHRVFALLQTETVSKQDHVDDVRPSSETAELLAKIEKLEALLERERLALDDMRADRESWRQQAKNLLAEPPKKKWWRIL